jgi:hypothetical protein
MREQGGACVSEGRAFEAPIRQDSSKGFPWLLTCGIGCGLIVLLAAVLIVGAAVMGTAALKEVKGEVVAALPGELEALKALGKLSEEQQKIFDELVSICQRPESSMSAAFATAFLIEAAKTAKEGEAQQVVDASMQLRDILRDKPGAGMTDLVPLLEQFPDLQRQFEENMRQNQDGNMQQT